MTADVIDLSHECVVCWAQRQHLVKGGEAMAVLLHLRLGVDVEAGLCPWHRRDIGGGEADAMTIAEGEQHD